MQSNIIQQVRSDLIENIDEKTKLGFQRFFKEKVKYYGVKSSASEKIAQKYFKFIKDFKKQAIYDLCEELFESGYGEEAWIAANWTFWIKNKFETNDIAVFERWIDEYIDDWAKCDTFCNHAVGSLVMQFPEEIKNLKVWAKSKNRWMRRASAVTLIIPAKRGLFMKDIFEIAGILLTDNDDMVQKGYGWMLKATSQANQQKVFEYVLKNKKSMPRTALRYAIEKMPQDLRKRAME